MAVYNGERFVQEQLESLVGQTRLPNELIVSDDASTDGSVEILRRFANGAPFPVRVLTNRENAGCAKNFARAIWETSGDLIFIADWDDVQYPQKLETMEAALLEAPGAGIGICDADLVDEDLRPLGKTLWQAHQFFPSRRFIRQISEGAAFSSRIITNGCCLAVRAKLKSLVLPLPSGGPFAVWYDSFIAWTVALSGAGGMALVDEPLFAYRQHRYQAEGAGGNMYSRLGLLRDRLARARERPRFGPLVDRLESLAAREYSTNSVLRRSALRHLRARLHMPRSTSARLPIVVRELIAGRYHRFSHGVAAAMKDLLFVE